MTATGWLTDLLIGDITVWLIIWTANQLTEFAVPDSAAAVLWLIIWTANQLTEFAVPDSAAAVCPDCSGTATEFSEAARYCNVEAFQTCSVLFKEIGGVCGTYGKNKNANRFLLWNLIEREHLEDLGVNGG